MLEMVFMTFFKIEQEEMEMCIESEFLWFRSRGIHISEIIQKDSQEIGEIIRENPCDDVLEGAVLNSKGHLSIFEGLLGRDEGSSSLVSLRQ